jgi:hypothetical protein
LKAGQEAQVRTKLFGIDGSISVGHIDQDYFANHDLASGSVL